MNLRVLLVCLLLAAGSASSVSASEPLSWYSPVVRASQIGERQLDDVERTYPLTTPRQIGGRLRMESSVTASGRLLGRTWELPAGHDAREALAAARRELEQQGGQLLFWCEGRECGPASLWTNQIFDLSRLASPDEQQASLLVRLDVPQAAGALVALYAVTRGNRRSYLHIEQLELQQPLTELRAEPDTLLRLLRERGELQFVEALGGSSDPQLLRLAGVLLRDTSMRVLLQGSEARRWRDELVARGVRERRMDIDMQPLPDGGLRVRWLR